MSNEITWRLENENIGRLLVHYAISRRYRDHG